MSDPGHRPIRRYVAIGDSSTAGLEDPDDAGGYRGWSRRLVAHLERGWGDIAYLNLGRPGLTTRQIRDGQLARAVAFRPDLATVFAGTNDVIGRRFDLDEVAADMAAMQHALVATGAIVLTFTLPDLAPVMPVARVLSPRIRTMNARFGEVAEETGAILVDFAAVPVATDPRLWHEDRIHANQVGHARIAAALAHTLGVPGVDGSWADDLPPRPPRSRVDRVREELHWIRRHLLPWIRRHGSPASRGERSPASTPSTPSTGR